MVHLSRITTGLGDDGETHLADMSRVPKTDPRIEAVGQVAEANAALGVARAAAGPLPRAGAVLARLQNEFFDLGADLSRPLSPGEDPGTLRIGAAWTAAAGADVEAVTADLAPLRSFLLPAGGELASRLHVAATVIRRAERAAWRAAEACGLDAPGGVNAEALRYLNRASDLVFVLARAATPAGGEELWVPADGRR
jgi:cob(I)alamin adenosyltransferase